MSECKYVRRIGQKWEFGIQRRTLCPVKRKRRALMSHTAPRTVMKRLVLVEVCLSRA